MDPVIWNELTGHVVGGHQRLKILKDLGRKKIQVSVVDLPEEKEKALCLALNKITGEWDVPKLEEILAEVEMFDFDDIEVTGFDPFDDANWRRRLEIPAIRQVGGMATVLAMIGDRPLKLRGGHEDMRRLAHKYAKQ